MEGSLSGFGSVHQAGPGVGLGLPRAAVKHATPLRSAVMLLGDRAFPRWQRKPTPFAAIPENYAVVSLSLHDTEGKSRLA